MSRREQKDKLTKKWWFWVILLSIVVIISIAIVISAAMFITTEGIHKVARTIQSIDNEATVYSSAGSNVVIVQIPNYTDESKANKKDLIVEAIKVFAKNELSNYSKFVLVSQIPSQENKDYFLNIDCYTMPQVQLETDSSNLYIDFLDITKQGLTDSKEKSKGEDIELSTGKYTVGEDIKAGKYDAIAKSGSGNFWVTGKNSVNEILSAKNDSFGTNQYSNLVLNNGDIIEIRSNLKVLLQAK